MASNASRGAAAKGRTKKYLAALGYQVANLEEVRWLWIPGKDRIPVKRDQFGGDLLAMNTEGIIVVQVKSGLSAVGGTFPAARREFAKFIWPAVGCKRWIIAWAPKARQPRIIEVFGYQSENFLELASVKST